MTIYKNDKAKNNPFWFQVMVDGKRVTRRGFRTKGEAQKARAELITELSRGEYVEASKKKFGAYFTEWLDSRHNISVSTRLMYGSYFRTHIEPEIGDVPLSKLTGLHIEKLIKLCREKGLADATVKRVFAAVNASLNAAEKKDIIAKNPAKKVEAPRVKRVERPVWDDEFVRKFLIASRDDSRYWIAVYMALATGMRQGEILGLKWSDVDLERGVIQIRRNLEKNNREFDKLKTERSRRTVAISEQDISVLKDHRDKQELEKVSLGAEYQDNELVICTSLGTPAIASKVIKAFKVMQARHLPHDEPTITFHDLRHTHASMLLKQGIHPKVVQERLGHSTITLTLDTYSHLLPNMQEDAALKLERILDIK